jgi:hypothetical protein
MTQEIKPCPFCRGKPLKYYFYNGNEVHVYCNEKGHYAQGSGVNEKEAIREWNTRAGERNDPNA